MIEVVTSRNALLYQDALADMFRLRHRHVAGLAHEEGAPDTASTDKDRFDTADALYLLLTEEDGAVIGAHRLLPTTGPHGLADEAPQFCDVRGVQRGEKIFELSMSFVDEGGLARPALEKARMRLTVGLFEFCLRAGCDKITWLMPTDLLFRLLLIGLNIKPLGLPVEKDGRRQVAVVVTVDRAALDALRLALNVPEAQVDYVGAPAGDPLVLAPFEPPQQPLAAAE